MVITEGLSQARPVALRLVDVEKRFGGVAALKGVTFEARYGEIHALLGENGAGKSTLMAIAAGALRPDAGTIVLPSGVTDAMTPLVGREAGLSIVYQHPALVPDLTVFENFSMALTENFVGLRKRSSAWVQDQLARVGCTASLGATVQSLTVVQRQLLEIAKALAAKPKILILDEPTAALSASDTAVLFAELRNVASDGCAVVYITHRLAEVRELCDRVTVLRDGEVRGTFTVMEITDGEILELIVGRAISVLFPPKGDIAVERTPNMVVEHVSGRGFHDVTFSALAGEIVGLGGIVGSGQSDFVRALAGLEPARGRVTIGGELLHFGSARSARSSGVVYLSSDRLREGLFTGLSVRENATVSSLEQFSRAGVVKSRAEAGATEEQRSALAIRTPSIEAEVSTLSGGNQQKVLLSRALVNRRARLILADEPTQGVDVGARVEIYRVLRKLAASGAAVVVVSSDVRELEGLCDRVVVFSAGTSVAELDGDDVREQLIAHAMMTSTARRHAASRLHVGSHTLATAVGARLRRASSGSYVASGVLAIVIVAIALYTQFYNDRYLSSFNLSTLTVLMASLLFISLGQACVIMTGGIDLSVGPLAGLVAVVGSFFENQGHSSGVLVLGFVVMFGVAIGVGLVNGVMVGVARFTPVAATLITYIALQGISLVLRPFQGGFISTSIINGISFSIVRGIAVALILAVGAAVGLEILLRKSRWGLALRAVGSNSQAAFRLGVQPIRIVIGAYVACSALTFFGGVLLMSEIGVGTPTQGISFTLAAVTAVVLGGTSIMGGRGSFLGVLFGAVLVEQLLNITTFLHINQAWQYWFEGFLVFVAVGIYTRATARNKIFGGFATWLRGRRRPSVEVAE